MLQKRFCFFFLDLVNEDVGLQHGKLATFPDQSLATSADQFSDNIDATKPDNGRLYKPSVFWCPKDNFKPNVYLELILVQEYYLFAVSVQGYLVSSADFTKDFRVSYSQDYADWEEYNQLFSVSCHILDKYHIIS